ncbi:hypothetical protein BDV40DRAFT_121379 [Aspergillus tamarii]|uniref:Proteasome assembly chaperone 3 n=1 Tax=Aspergillus tamarii TaxID=41984 RepID=A0A5N6V070_ASPTM|nr:hypothetical protein BDV40DRAFT_121379 [Aspergillus tamarii]
MAEPFNLSELQEPLNLPFPATTKQVAGLVNGIQTDVMCMSFNDRILVTISQEGRLGHWVCSLQKFILDSQLMDDSYMYHWKTKTRELKALTLSQARMIVFFRLAVSLRLHSWEAVFLDMTQLVSYMLVRLLVQL